jgi:hypothetical protein
MAIMIDAAMPVGMRPRTSVPVTFRDISAAPLQASQPAAPLERRDQAALSGADHVRFLNVLSIMIASGDFGSLVAIHSDMTHRMHNMGPSDPTSAVGQQRFLPWHRVYLYQLEQYLTNIYPGLRLALPYWDWTKEPRVPEWVARFTPTVTLPLPGSSTVLTASRTPSAQKDLEQAVSRIPEVMAATDYTTFATKLEQVHNAVHLWVGGTMSVLSTASADPLFWMHHANVDRLWWEWYKEHPDQNPHLEGADATMDPWTYQESDTRGLDAFGYTYV